MGQAQVIITVRTFSGPNLGAEVMLPPGTYLIGTDYSCDIVLGDSGMAPRHAALTAEPPQPGGLPRVSVKPLDAEIRLEEGSVPAQGREIPPATPWYLGLTCLSWNIPGAPREEIVPRLPGQPVQTGQVALARQARADRDDAGAAGNVVGGEPATALPKKRRWPLRLVLLSLLIAIGALTFELRTSPDSTEELAVKLCREVRQAGLDRVVVGSESGRITVSGTVLNEKERGLLWSMAQNLKCPVYIRVNVRDDMAQAVRMKFNTSGIFPEVTFPGGGDAMRVAAYIKDLQTEDAVFTSLNKDMPDLPQIEKRIVHADQLKEFIKQGLDQARLRNVNIVLGPGRIELTDTSSSGNHDALQLVMKQIEENLNIPLPCTIISQDSPRHGTSASQVLEPLVPGGISPDMPASPVNSPLEGMRITGVTMGAMRFISLGNGQRIFEGGALPGGHVLESISLDALTLNKDGRTTTYPLRGNNE